MTGVQTCALPIWRGGDGGGDAPAARQPGLTPMELIEQTVITCGVREEQLQQRQHHQYMPAHVLGALEEQNENISNVTLDILTAGTDLSEAASPPRRTKTAASATTMRTLFFIC